MHPLNASLATLVFFELTPRSRLFFPTQIRVLEHSRQQKSVVYIVGKSDVSLDGGHAPGVRGKLRRLLLGVPFAWMHKFFQDDVVSSYGVPRAQALQVVLPFDF